MDTEIDNRMTLDDLLRIPVPRRQSLSRPLRKDDIAAGVASQTLSGDSHAAKEENPAEPVRSSVPLKPVSLRSFLEETDIVFRKSDEERVKDASIDWVFTGEKRPATSQGLSRVRKIRPSISQPAKPMRFVDRREILSPPAGLTYAHVPHDRDSRFKYCGACVFADLKKCQYCHASKLSKEHRLALPRSTSLLIQHERNLKPRDLAMKLAKYARDDDFCRLLNAQLGWEPTLRSSCSVHLGERSSQEENDEVKRKQFEALSETLAKSVSTINQLNCEIESMRTSTFNMESRNAELGTQLRQAQFEATKIAEQSDAQSCIITCLRDELKTKPQTADRELQTSAWANVDREIQTVLIETSDGTTQTTFDVVIERRETDEIRTDCESKERLARTPMVESSQSNLIGKKRLKRETRLIPLQSLLDMIHEVVEKKIQNTQAAIAAGKRPDGLAEYVKIFWREKLGLRKLANKKVGEMIHAVKAYSKQHARVLWFAEVLGVKNAKTNLGDDIPWIPWIASSTFDLLAQIFDNAVPKPFVERHKAINALTGSSGVLDATVRLNDPSTWKPPSLRDMMDPSSLMRLLEDINLMIIGDDKKNGVATDEFLDILLRHQVEATIRHQKALTAAFHRFDGGEPGLDPAEFTQLLTWAVMPENPPDDVDALYYKIESLADANLLADKNDRNINDSITFPIVIMQQVPSCPLALAKNCRLWWTLDD